MTDFSVTSGVTGENQDTRWRASSHGEDAARPGQLDPTKFTAGTHYNIGGKTDGTIPSGVGVAKLASGLYAPYDATAGEEGDPQRTLAGYVNDNAGVPVSAKATFALLVHGIVKPSLLPIAAQRTSVLTADATCSITYVED